MNKRSQIAQTINWTVATIIIIVVLAVSFFVVRAGDTGKFVLPDKQKDFVATKSIVNFVEDNQGLIESSVVSEDYSEFDKKFRPFLESLYSKTCKDICIYDGAWNLNIYGEGLFLKHPLYLYNLGDEENYDLEFDYIFGDEEIKLKFWKESGWINL